MLSSSSSLKTTATKLIRLNKLLVQWNLAGSRRQADEYIRAGYVYYQGSVVTQVGTKVPLAIPNDNNNNNNKLPHDLLQVKLPTVQYPHQKYSERTVLFHKPIGVVSGTFDRDTTTKDGSNNETKHIPAIRLCTSDKEYPKSTNDTPPPNQLDHGGQSRRFAVAGRLDYHSSGLLVLTQSGAIARQLTSSHSSDNKNKQTAVEKEYWVQVGVREKGSSTFSKSPNHWPLKMDQLVAQLQQGVTSRKRRRKQQECRGNNRIHPDSTKELLTAKSVAILPRSKNRHNNDTLQVVLTQGRNHHIRRMIASCRYPSTIQTNDTGPHTKLQWYVHALHRVRIGKIRLADLPVGHWRYLQPEESF